MAALPVPGFAQSRLLRHSSELDETGIPAQDAADVRHVLMVGDRFLVRGASAILDPAAGLPRLDVRRRIFLGRVDGFPVFAADSPAEPAPELAQDLRSLDLRSIAVEAAVEAEELGLLAVAKSMLDWHARHGFCANCGTATRVRAGGFRRECPACDAHHFPRVDPVVIMLVRRGDACLLGRAPRFKEGMYSCLAGFVEPGETVEDAVRREIFEETQVRVGEVAYQVSQPWPFPSSLMLGCAAEALDEAIVADPAELVDARWFPREEVRAMMEARHPDGLFVPPPMAIAHVLMRGFVDGRD